MKTKPHKPPLLPLDGSVPPPKRPLGYKPPHRPPQNPTKAQVRRGNDWLKP